MKKILNGILDYVVIFIGASIFGASVNIFTAPNDIAPGGLTGIGTMLNYLFDLPIGVVILVLNIPLFIWGAIENGKQFLAKTVVATVFVSLIIDLTEPITYKYQGDTLLAAIFGGLFAGVGLAFIFFRGGSSGGTDIISRIIHKHHPHISMGTVGLVCDMVIFIAAAVVYNSIESALYAIITKFVTSKVLDAMLYGTAHDNGKLMFIITSNYEEVSQLIIDQIGRGVTQLDAHGAYSNDSKKVLLCAVRPSQVHKIKTLVHSVDTHAFIIVTTAGTINGKGFVSSENS